jgi:hypothetical protein
LAALLCNIRAQATVQAVIATASTKHVVTGTAIDHVYAITGDDAVIAR